MDEELMNAFNARIANGKREANQNDPPIVPALQASENGATLQGAGVPPGIENHFPKHIMHQVLAYATALANKQPNVFLDLLEPQSRRQGQQRHRAAQDEPTFVEDFTASENSSYSDGDFMNATSA